MNAGEASASETRTRGYAHGQRPCLQARIPREASREIAEGLPACGLPQIQRAETVILLASFRRCDTHRHSAIKRRGTSEQRNQRNQDMKPVHGLGGCPHGKYCAKCWKNIFQSKPADACWACGFCASRRRLVHKSTGIQWDFRRQPLS